MSLMTHDLDILIVPSTTGLSFMVIMHGFGFAGANWHLPEGVFGVN